MKKIFFLICSVLMITFISGCTENTKRVSYQNTIHTKQECISEIKDLLNITDVYYFDCDFTKMNSITITDISYNISVSATLLYDKNNKKYYADLNKQANIKMVANYKITSNSTSFGFSIISSVINPKMDHYKNDVFVKTTPNVIYNKDTYSGINDLKTYGGGTTYQDNICAEYIAVPKNFYPCELMPNAISAEALYLKIDGNINSMSNYEIIDTPVRILTHYQTVTDKNNDNVPILNNIINYFNNNATYCQY